MIAQINNYKKIMSIKKYKINNTLKKINLKI